MQQDEEPGKELLWLRKGWNRIGKEGRVLGQGFKDRKGDEEVAFMMY